MRRASDGRDLHAGGAAVLAACVLAVLPGAVLADGDQALALHDLFRSHAVLQRERPVPVWGWATPGVRVTVSLGEVSATVRAAADGAWRAVLPAQPAGGPHTLDVRTDDGGRRVVEDVLIGDVWLCAGQSNMELPLHRALDARAEIANSANDAIRLLKVGQSSSATRLERFATPVRWHPATPESVADFSAACFYFARELQKHVPVPMGLINASWGGSRIESWMSREALRAVGGFEELLGLLERHVADPGAAIERWGATWQAWWRSRPGVSRGDEPWSMQGGLAGEWRRAPAGLGPWEEWGDPDLAAFNGLVWYRTEVSLTEGQARQAAELSLGPVDEIDQTWVNGRAAGTTSGHATPRRYALPRGTLRAGRNAIVVAVLDTYGSGGLYGPADARALHLEDGVSIPLDGEWRYRIVPADMGSPPRAPWEATGGLSTIGNGMLAPLGAYGIRGVVWYQGESNTGEARRYERLLKALVADWRSVHGAELPVLIVQLANYGMPPTRPVESGWAELREAQRRVALSDPRVGLAVTIDIGDRYDIHPPNKQEVGRRLARAARHVVYGEALAPSGPVPRGARRDGRFVVVSFADVSGELIAYGAEAPIGFELCTAQPDSCRYAQGMLEPQRILLQVPEDFEPARVRYCWADGPVCTLYDGAGLPAGPFEIPIEEP
ncbi:MAG: 9-O-acetylesterase [Proteobacteria bacterium]|nr:MAG: 9-O-acetylesterase [Pseudomonadota bacterium]